DFESALVFLKEVRGVKFGDFLTPGETLQITAEAIKTDGDLTTVKATAQKEGRTTVSARLVLQRRSCDDPERLKTDEDVRRRAKKQFAELFGPIELIPAQAAS
ncbi:MAG: beta-hydroxyacyl-ACP dehydratase, partial [Novipirellula sp. JB048]